MIVEKHCITSVLHADHGATSFGANPSTTRGVNRRSVLTNGSQGGVVGSCAGNHYLPSTSACTSLHENKQPRAAAYQKAPNDFTCPSNNHQTHNQNKPKPTHLFLLPNTIHTYNPTNENTNTMGTRHLILVYYNGAYHIAQYGQWDGYPSGQGLTVLRFCRDPTNLASLAAALAAALVYEPTPAQLEAWDAEAAALQDEYDAQVEEHYGRRAQQLANGADKGAWLDEVDTRPAKPMQRVCPSVSRETGAGVLALVAGARGERVPVVREVGFVADTLFCEWAYVVDLDEGVLEVWSAGVGPEEGLESGRFEGLEEVGVGGGPGLVARWALGGLPDEAGFLSGCERGRDEEGRGDDDEEVSEDGVEGVEDGQERRNKRVCLEGQNGYGGLVEQDGQVGQGQDAQNNQV